MMFWKLFSMKWFSRLKTLKIHQMDCDHSIMIQFGEKLLKIFNFVLKKFQIDLLIRSGSKLGLIEKSQIYSVTHFNGHYNGFHLLISCKSEFSGMNQISFKHADGMYFHPICSIFGATFLSTFFTTYSPIVAVHKSRTRIIF